MKTKNILSITNARKKIFSIAKEMEKKENVSYVLTQNGLPKIVMLSVDRYQEMAEKPASALMLGDGNLNQSAFSGRQAIFPRTLIIRDESRVVYLSGNDQNKRYVEENLIKAQLFVQLIEKYHYPSHLVEFGRYVKVGLIESRHFIEADVIVNDDRGNVKMIFEVGTFSDFEKNTDIIISDLFSLAASLSWIKKPQYLIYYSRSAKNMEIKEKVLAVDYLKFNTFLAWKRAGRPKSEKIPFFERNSD